MPLPRNPWRQVKEFAALDGNATYLWPRWLVLRAVGVVYVLIFAGIIVYGRALVGPGGITPLSGFFEAQGRMFPNAAAAFFSAPSLFWVSTSWGTIAALEWCGLAAAVALVLNLWPRMALFVCWLVFLSFITTGNFFAVTQPDQLMIEAALLCIPFAPAGFRPGLGAKSPPRPIAVFMARWLLLRIMFEAGVMKLVFGTQWRNFTAMDVMYETTPFPTILGYLDHQMPHAYHVFEWVLTFAAELAAPLLAVFAGRRGRWIAFALWFVFQAGIELTNNFGWLNFAAIGLGILLLDDQMLISAARRFRLQKLAHFLGSTATAPPSNAIGPWRLWGLRAGLGLQFCLTLFFLAASWELPPNTIPRAISWPAEFFFRNFHSSNAYPLFEGLPAVRYELEFEGSNDDGETWRIYPFRYQPQRVDRICSFIAPWYARFEAALEITLIAVPHSTLFTAVASHLIRGDPKVIALFERNPFPDRPPMLIRMAIYRLKFTDLETYRKTGHFWHKEYEGDFVPYLYIDEHGQIEGGK